MSKTKINENLRTVHIVDDNKSPFAITESFRKIVTNINFTIPKKQDGRGRIFCVTSTVAKEGKTTVAVNLAVTCARMGAKTVIVDCDFRKPSVKRYFQNCSNKGLVPYLSGQDGLDDVTAKEVEPNLDVIATLQLPPNPLILINSGVFDDLLEELSKRYEYVIIDTPPLGLVSDSSVIGKKVDGALLVTRQAYSNHKIIKNVIGALEFAQVRILGFVLNDFSLSSVGYRYGKYGKYGNYGDKR